MLMKLDHLPSDSGENKTSENRRPDVEWSGMVADNPLLRPYSLGEMDTVYALRFS